MIRLKWFNTVRLALFAAVLPGSGPAVSGAAPDPPPNIVFIFVDDQGYYDLGCYGASEVETPRIDAMAKAAFACRRSPGGLGRDCNQAWNPP